MAPFTAIMRMKISTGIATAFVVLTPGVVPLYGQFTLPVPRVFETERVLTEDIQIRFRQVMGLKAVTALAKQSYGATEWALIEEFCTDEQYPLPACQQALNQESLAGRLRWDQELNTISRGTYVAMFSPIPAGRSRTTIASYLRRSGLEEGLDFASNFGASYGEHEAYITSNIVRGLAGSYLFSADYAVVVAKADTGTIEQRKSIEDSKSNVGRAILNGGTIAGRLTIPMYAGAGGSGAYAAGVSIAGGFLGPLKEEANARQLAVGSIVAEAVNTIALRSMGGSLSSEADLLLGLRLGWTQAEGPIKVGGHDRSVSFLQALIGVRQKGSMAFSGLITITEGNFRSFIPRIVINYTASR